MPFLTFILPFFAPRPWHALLAPLLLLLAAFMPGDFLPGEPGARGIRGGRILSEPAALWTYALVHHHWGFALGNGLGLGVGLTMASRAIGGLAAWGILLVGTALCGVHLSLTLGSHVTVAGASPAVFVALGMSTTSWLRLREEITYPRRADRLAGFGALFLTAAAMATPFLLSVAQGELASYSPEEFARFVLVRVQPVHITGLFVGALGAAVLPRTW